MEIHISCECSIPVLNLPCLASCSTQHIDNHFSTEYGCVHATLQTTQTGSEELLPVGDAFLHFKYFWSSSYEHRKGSGTSTGTSSGKIAKTPLPQAPSKVFAVSYYIAKHVVLDVRGAKSHEHFDLNLASIW